MAGIIRAAEAEYETAMGTLEPGLAARYKERCRQATRDGAVGGGGKGGAGGGAGGGGVGDEGGGGGVGSGGGSGGGGGDEWKGEEDEAPEGRWLVPPPIADETAFRRRVNGAGNDEDEDEDEGVHMMTS
jgi:hypothetical protein